MPRFRVFDGGRKPPANLPPFDDIHAQAIGRLRKLNTELCDTVNDLRAADATHSAVLDLIAARDISVTVAGLLEELAERSK